MKTNRVLLFVSIIALLTFSSFTNLNYQDKSKKFIVVLDAGHGGHDSGNLGSGFVEKDIALKIVLEVGAVLSKNPNIKVVYTRDKDVFVDLFKRGQIANKANADLFVSVHCNAHHSSAHGTETFVLGTHRNKTNFEVAKKENSVIFLEDDYKKNYAGFDPNSPESVMSILISQEEYLDQSIQLASLIQKKFTNKLKRNNRGVKQAGFIVLHQTVMPSVLVETGFLTFKEEGAYLNSKKGQHDMSTSIADAILEYKHILDGNMGDYVFEDHVNHDTEVETVIETIADSKPSATNNSNIVFKVQISASSKSLETKSFNFNGLENITKEKAGNLYKYYYGSTSNFEETKILEKEAIQKGYNSCFTVAFKDGKKISVSEALKSKSN
ncbi:N-acetylmuramoyl-L-alanine amidase family protein [Siansivirga zeaxanthinifaciens]|uniref:N-acetylmuramoyl-L-alanine amidase n=1 Tax=Siansivirga zeaxanthinifaciens CC-SAMT-1 TaxID=1454006 RepID=A0A0C5WD19_9FLAO|nr:N-acetylmuramoyl-L-alanine amidase [Siansivirga zeaxanthinifaciens]AJR04162.1 N-acetylmuramoyl-L-alanine amidase [Siansivirga zeaxanthinifaciens CC-SAMT-1]